MPSRSAPTAAGWPWEAVTGWSASGMRNAASRSGTRSARERAGRVPSRSAPTAAGWPWAAVTGWSASGMPGVRGTWRRLPGDMPERSRASPSARDGGWLASGSVDRTIRLWNVRDDPSEAQPFQLKGHNSPVTSIAFSPDGTTLASGSGDDNVIILWDVAARSALGEPLQPATGRVSSVAFSRDGARLASGSADGDITVWDVDTGLLGRAPVRPHEPRSHARKNGPRTFPMSPCR